MKIDTSQFEKAIADLAKSSMKSDKQLITTMGMLAVRSINFNTPVKSGTLRAGWWPAWTGLGMNGQPSRQPLGLNKYRNGESKGTFKDNRNALNPSIEFANETVAIEKDGKTYRYGNRLNFGPGKHHGFLDKGIGEATGKIIKKASKEYEQQLRRASRGQ